MSIRVRTFIFRFTDERFRYDYIENLSAELVKRFLYDHQVKKRVSCPRASGRRNGNEPQ